MYQLSLFYILTSNFSNVRLFMFSVPKWPFTVMFPVDIYMIFLFPYVMSGLFNSFNNNEIRANKLFPFFYVSSSSWKFYLSIEEVVASDGQVIQHALDRYRCI